MRGRRAGLGAAIAVASSVALMVVPTAMNGAAAETLAFNDGTSTQSGIDIHRVRIRHEQRLTVTVRHEDIDRGDPDSITLWIDNRPGRKGPEFIYSAGIGGDSDYYLRRAKSWRKARSMPMTCWYGLDVDYRDEVTRIPIGRKCLGDHDRVRISIRAQRWIGDNDYYRDWAPDRFKWSPWVSRG